MKTEYNPHDLAMITRDVYRMRDQALMDAFALTWRGIKFVVTATARRAAGLLRSAAHIGHHPRHH